MTDAPDPQNVIPVPRARRLGRGCGVCLGLLLFALVASNVTLVVELPWHLLTGWWAFAERSADRCRVVWPDVAMAAIAVGILLLGTHRVARWLVSASSESSWPFLRSVRLVCGTLLLFTAGIALLGIAHQCVWLSRSNSRLLDNNFLEFSSDRKSPLRNVGNALLRSQERAPNDAPDETGSHSWVLPLLPYLDSGSLAEKFDTSVSWNDPRNAEALRTSIPALLSPAMNGTHDEHGFAVSHFAANKHVVSTRGTWPGQGDENTILIGEAFFRHRAWGDPRNVRDPLDGINRKPDGFGCAGSEAALFLMGDGSVRRMSQQTDPSVLRQISRAQSGRD